jgi:hypothetical protein
MKPIPWKWKVFAFVMLILFLFSASYVIILIINVFHLDNSGDYTNNPRFQLRFLLREIALLLFLVGSFQLFVNHFSVNKNWYPLKIWQTIFYCLASFLLIAELQTFSMLLLPLFSKPIEAPIHLVIKSPSITFYLIRTLHFTLIIYQLIYSYSLLRLRIKAYQKLEEDTIHQIGQ